MNAAWWAAHKKAVGAFLSVLVTQASALLALGILNGQTAHNVALAIELVQPILVFLGVKAAPANVEA